MTKTDPKSSGKPSAASGKDANTKAARTPAGVNKSDEPAGKKARKAPSPVMRRNIVGVIAIIALLVAIGAVGWFSYRAYEVYVVDNPTQQSRDDATSAAEQAMLNVTTINPKDMGAFDARLQSSFTGDALEQVRQQIVATLDPALKKSGDQAGSTSSRVVRSAATQVDANEGTAQVLVYLAVTGKAEGQASETPSTMGFLVGMTKIDDTWKASKVTPLDGITVDGDSNGANGSGAATESAAPTSTPAGGN